MHPIGRAFAGEGVKRRAAGGAGARLHASQALWGLPLRPPLQADWVGGGAGGCFASGDPLARRGAPGVGARLAAAPARAGTRIPASLAAVPAPQATAKAPVGLRFKGQSGDGGSAARTPGKAAALGLLRGADGPEAVQPLARGKGKFGLWRWRRGSGFLAERAPWERLRDAPGRRVGLRRGERHNWSSGFAVPRAVAEQGENGEARVGAPRRAAA